MWCVGINPESGSRDELVVGDCRVIWYQGLDPSTQTVCKVYTVDTPILQAFWCNFSESEGGAKGRGSICIREQGCLGVYMENGAVHHVPFPFHVSYHDMHAYITQHDGSRDSGKEGVASGERCVSGATDSSWNCL